MKRLFLLLTILWAMPLWAQIGGGGISNNPLAPPSAGPPSNPCPGAGLKVDIDTTNNMLYACGGAGNWVSIGGAGGSTNLTANGTALTTAGNFLITGPNPWTDTSAVGIPVMDGISACAVTVAGANPNKTLTLTGTGACATWPANITSAGEEIQLASNTAGSLTQSQGTTEILASTGYTRTSGTVVTLNANITQANAAGYDVVAGHNDTPNWQTWVNAFPATGGRGYITRTGTGTSVIGTQTMSPTTMTRVQSGALTASVVTATVGTNPNLSGITIGTYLVISGCSAGAGTPGNFNANGMLVTGLTSTTITWGQAVGNSTDTCTNGTISITGFTFPTQTGMVIEGQGGAGLTNTTSSSVRLVTAMSYNPIMTVGARGTSINNGPKIYDLDFQDGSGTGAAAGGLRCIQCKNGRFEALTFFNFNGVFPMGALAYPLWAYGLQFDSSYGGGDFVSAAQIANNDSEVNHIANIKCRLNSVCVDAGQTIGTDQDGPYGNEGSYIQVGNALHKTNTNTGARAHLVIATAAPFNSSAVNTNLPNCFGFLAAGALHIDLGLIDVGASGSGDDCVAVWEHNGRSSINGSEEQHSTAGLGTGLWVTGGVNNTLDLSVSGTTFTRDATGQYVTVQMTGGANNPYTAGQLVVIGNATPLSPDDASPCTFNSANGDSGRALILTSTTGANGSFTYWQPCAARAGATATPTVGSILGLIPSANMYSGQNFSYCNAVQIDAGASNTTAILASSSNGCNPDYQDAGTGTDVMDNTLANQSVPFKFGVPSSQASDVLEYFEGTNKVLSVASTGGLLNTPDGTNGVSVNGSGVLAKTGTGHVNADQCNGISCVPTLDTVGNLAATATNTFTGTNQWTLAAGVTTAVPGVTITNANSTNNNASTALTVSTTGTSTGAIPLIVNEGTSAGDITDFQNAGVTKLTVTSGGNLTLANGLITLQGTTPSVKASAANAALIFGGLNASSGNSTGTNTFQGGDNSSTTASNGAEGADMRGGNQTGATSNIEQGGHANITGGNVSSTGTGSTAGPVVIQPGACTQVASASTCNGTVKILQAFFTTGTATQHSLACVTATNTVATCSSAANDANAIGWIDSVSTNTVYVQVGIGQVVTGLALSATFTAGQWACADLATTAGDMVASATKCANTTPGGIVLTTATTTNPVFIVTGQGQ